MKLNKILFPVDFSERCRAAAPFVQALARKHNASVTLANFVELPMVWYAAAEAPVIPEMDIARLIEEAEHSLTLFAGEFFPGTATSVVVQQREPGIGIVEMAQGVDLIMMPTHGRGLFRAALLGSITAKVLHDAECPVWTSAHGDSTGPAASTQWNKIVCSISTSNDDTSDEALSLLRFAAELAKDCGSAVELVHAIPAAPDAGPERYFDRDFDIFLRDSAAKAIDAMQKQAGTNFPVSIESGSVSSVVAAIARDSDANLVLVGRGAIPHFAGRLRTHVYAIIRDVPCPVLTL